MADQSPLCVKSVDNHNNMTSILGQRRRTLFGAVYTEEQRLHEANIFWSVETYQPLVVTCRLDHEADVSSVGPSSSLAD